MSWFDTSGFANLAKTALKEAQKTIDKALDIKDEDQGAVVAPKTTPEEDADGFFASWGLKTSGSSSVGDNKNSTSSALMESEPAPSTSNSIWGSFTGSFFETGTKPETDRQSLDGPVFKQPQKSLLNLTASTESGDSSSQGWVSTEEGPALSDEDVSSEKFRESKLVVNEPDSPYTVEVRPSLDPVTVRPPITLNLLQQQQQRPVKIEDVIPLRKAVSSGGNNRLSIISSSTGSPDDGCCSGESVEVLGSTSEDSMSPETGFHSRGKGLGESSPESVCVLGAGSGGSSVTSPSSVEVLQGWSEANSPLSPPGPPRLLPSSQVLTSQLLSPSSAAALHSISPESVEVIGDDESETSLADDCSSTSASSTTTTTVMLPPPPVAVSTTVPVGESSLPVLPEGVVAEGPHVRSLLAEAMEDQSSEHSNSPAPISGSAQREQSPISSESRSEAGPRQGSGQTSGDELETATSSDIEIISSPNGDGGSSTHSRHSPTKIPNLSLQSLLSSPSPVLVDSPDSTHASRLPLGLDDVSETTVEAVSKKLLEMTTVLEARESKLIELSRTNVELQEANVELQRQLDAGLRNIAAAQDVTHVTEEFTQRLSSLERKFQQAIRERDSLKRQLEQAKQEANSRMAASQLESTLAEREEEVKELREEGEKLSKQQLQLSTLVKKLRAKEKELETAAKDHKQQIADLGQEAERLKRSLAAREEVERSQIEAVDRLTAQVRRHQNEVSSLSSQLSESTAAKEKIQAALDASMKEIASLRSSQLSAELAQQATLVAKLAEAEANAVALQNQHEIIVEQLRAQLAAAAEESSQREEALRREQAALLRRLTTAESCADELAHAASEATTPILRQLEALQMGVSQQQAAAERAERALQEKLAEAQARLVAAMEDCRMIHAQRATFVSQNNALQNEITSLNNSVQELRCKNDELMQDKSRLLTELKRLEQQKGEELSSLQRDVLSLRDQLSIQQAALDAEKRHCLALRAELMQHQQHSLDNTEPSTPVADFSSTTPGLLTVSLQQLPATHSPPPPRSASSPASLTESLLGASWHEEDPPASASALQMEALQSQLKRREGEVALLRGEARRLELQRTELTHQVATLSERVDTQTTELARLKELEPKYDALLQMYGEQLEANQELRLDLDDVKEMYRSQIEALLAGQTTSSSY